MSTNVLKTEHVIEVRDGRYIQLPIGVGGQRLVNMAPPENIHSADSVQKYPLGTKFVAGLNTYFYCYAGGTVNTEWGVYKAKKTNTVAVAPTQATATQADGYVAGTVGSRFVTVTIDTEIGVLTTGVLSENELAGGFVVVGNGASQHPQMFQIISHPALATTGGSLTIELDQPLATAVTAATTTIELMESPFYCLKADGSGGDYVTFIGIAAANATSGQYFWCQTRGIAWITSDGNTCDSAKDRTVVWQGNGSLVSSNDITMESGFQIAGVAMDMSGSGASNAPMVYLMGMG